MKPYFKLAPVALAFALAFAQTAQADVTMDLSAPNVLATPGVAFEVPVSLTLSAPLAAWGVTVRIDWSGDLSFDAAQSLALGQSWAAFTALFSDPVLSDPLKITPGHIDGSALLSAPLNLPAGASTLDLKFTAIGSSTINYYIEFNDVDFNVISAAGSSSVTVSAVPEVNPAMMLAAGLAVMGLLARRRRA
ncbi:hypothetical protein [Roseateles sp. P5_E7]